MLELEKKLKEFFGYNNFRNHQKEIIQAALEQKDVLAHEFMLNSYPKMSHMKYLAEKLSLDIKSIIIFMCKLWF